jgi:hypothetical protein
MSEGNWGRLWLAAAIGALIFVAWKMRRQFVAMVLLWTPLVFYALSIAYGSVPIHVSTWWPFATFNQRYGLQLLPVLAVSAGVLAANCFRINVGGRHRGKLVAVLLALIVASYASVWKAKPQCFLEAQKNWTARYPLNAAVQRVITHLPPHSVFPDGSERARRHYGSGGDSVTPGHQQRKSPPLDSPNRSGRTVGAGARQS